MATMYSKPEKVTARGSAAVRATAGSATTSGRRTGEPLEGVRPSLLRVADRVGVLQHAVHDPPDLLAAALELARRLQCRAQARGVSHSCNERLCSLLLLLTCRTEPSMSMTSAPVCSTPANTSSIDAASSARCTPGPQPLASSEQHCGVLDFRVCPDDDACDT